MTEEQQLRKMIEDICRAEEQLKALHADLDRAEKSCLITKVTYHVDYHCGDFMVIGIEFTSDVFVQLLDYLHRTYPELRFRQCGRYVHYGL